MKRLFIALIALILASSFIATSPGKKSKVVSYKVDTQKSTLIWTGRKVTGEHTGTINISGGSISAEKKVVKGGNFDIDLASITVTDLKDKNSNAKLLGHLKSDDFFAVDKHPISKFIITSITTKGGDQYDVKGNLTIKGITNEVSFPATIKVVDNNLTATAKVKIDRTKYDIKYRSTNFFENLGDKAIYDDFDLDINLVAAVAAI